MGTRNLTEVVFDGKIVVGQYGQWDGYPSGAGVTVIKFIKNRLLNGDFEAFKENLKECRFITQEELNVKYASLGIDTSSDFISIEDSHRFRDVYPQLHRDIGSGVLEYILDNGPCDLVDSSEFIHDGLFCEWAYILDLDNECLEVYGGKGKNYTVSKRFENESMECYKVKFKDLAEMSLDDFVNNCGGY